MNKKLNGFNNGRDTTEGVGGNEVPQELTPEEFKALRDNDIYAQTFYTVQYPDSKEVIAMFKEKEWAEDWKWVNCRTGIIEPFTIIVK
jgi:hypothetical protein